MGGVWEVNSEVNSVNSEVNSVNSEVNLKETSWEPHGNLIKHSWKPHGDQSNGRVNQSQRVIPCLGRLRHGITGVFYYP